MKAISSQATRHLQVLAPLALGVFALNALETSAQAAPFKSKKGYTLTAPARWKVNQSGMMGTDVMLLAPTANNFTSNVNVVVTPVPASATLEQLKSQIAPMYSKMFTGFKMQKQSYGTLGGKRALSSIATYKLGSPARSVRMEQMVAMNKNQAFIITSTSLVANTKNYQPAFQSIFRSLRFTR